MSYSLLYYMASSVECRYMESNHDRMRMKHLFWPLSYIGVIWKCMSPYNVSSVGARDGTRTRFFRFDRSATLPLSSRAIWRRRDSNPRLIHEDIQRASLPFVRRLLSV